MLRRQCAAKLVHRDLARALRAWIQRTEEALIYYDVAAMQFSHVVLTPKTDGAPRSIEYMWRSANREKQDWALLHASQSSQLATVQTLVGRGAQVGVTDGHGQNALHVAAFAGYIDVVRELLDAEGIDVDATDSNGFTALLLASLRGHHAIMLLLVEAGGGESTRMECEQAEAAATVEEVRCGAAAEALRRAAAQQEDAKWMVEEAESKRAEAEAEAEAEARRVVVEERRTEAEREADEAKAKRLVAEKMAEEQERRLKMDCACTNQAGPKSLPGIAARSSQQETSAAAGSTVIESGEPPTTIGLLWLGAPSSCSVSARLYCPACINGLSSRTQLCSRSAEHATSYVRSSATMGDGPLPHGGDAQANLSSPFACFCRWLGSCFLTASVPRSRSRAETEPFTGAVLSRVALSLS